MKTLLEFVVKHKLTNNTVTIDFPKFTYDGDYNFTITGTRKINVPNKPVVVYKDKYHKMLHLADFKDMLESIGCWLCDYEDFSEKDIIASFDTFKEAAEYVLNDESDRYYDDEDFLQSCIDGEEDNDDLDTPKDINCSKTIIDTAGESWDVTVKDGVKMP